MMKAQTGELKEATEAVVLDIKQLGESVSDAFIFHLMHINHLREGFRSFHRNAGTHHLLTRECQQILH